MSQENVETVRGLYAQWSQGDFRTDLDVLDPLVLFVLPPEFPDAGNYLGLECVRQRAEALEAVGLRE
jgi:ketosteroid isomerase-like protein